MSSKRCAFLTLLVAFVLLSLPLPNSSAQTRSDNWRSQFRLGKTEQVFSQVEGVVEPVGFGVSVTNADLIMADGKSLENAGVTPDELVLPTVQDMRGGLDPVLAHAASLVGAKMDSKKAGELFPEWKQ